MNLSYRIIFAIIIFMGYEFGRIESKMNPVWYIDLPLFIILFAILLTINNYFIEQYKKEGKK